MIFVKSIILYFYIHFNGIWQEGVAFEEKKLTAKYQLTFIFTFMFCILYCFISFHLPVSDIHCEILLSVIFCCCKTEWLVVGYFALMQILLLRCLSLADDVKD